MPTSADKFSSGYKGKKKAKKKPKTVEVAGPYRDQSSVPSIRKEATPREHRKVRVTPPKPSPPKLTEAQFKQKFHHELEKAGLTGSPVSDVVDVVKTGLGFDNPDPTQKKVTKAIRDTAEEEAKHLYSEAKKAVKKNLSPEGVGGPKSYQAPTKGEAELLAAGTSFIPAKEAATVGGKALEKTVSEASTASTVAKKAAAAVREAPKRKIARIKSAPARTAERVKKIPRQVKNAPKELKQAATTSEGRRAAAKGAGKTAAKHPVRTGYAGAVVLPEGVLPGDVTKRARAFGEGTVNALTNDPGKVAETTAHGALGFLKFPLGVAASTVEAAKQGSPDPLVNEVKTTGKGILDMGEKLASGNPKLVQKTTEEETGLTPFIPVPHVLRRLKGTKAYEDTIRGTIRDTVEGRRAKKRAAAQEKMRTAAEAGEHVSKKAAKKAKPPVADSARPGENYVLRRVGKGIEKQRERHYIARESARMGSGDMAGAIATEKVARKLRRSKGTNQAEINHGEALRTLGKHGIPVTPESLKFIERVHNGYEPWKHGDTPLKGEVLDRHATQYILDHPEVLGDKHVAAGLKEMNKQIGLVGGHSRRNQLMAQRDNIVNPIRKEEGKAPILAPEEQIPDAAAAALPKKPGGGEWSRVEAFDFVIGREKQLTEMRQEAQRLEANFSNPAAVADLRREAARIQRSQKEFFGAMKGLMKPPEFGGAEGGVSTTRAVAWTPAMESKFSKQMVAEQKRLGLEEPTPYLADRFPKGLEQDQVAPNFKPQIPLNKIWPSRGIAAKSGNALADLESTLHNSLAIPLQRKAAVRSLKRIITNIERPIDGGRVFTRRQAERLANTGKVPDGTLFVRRQALRALLENADEMTPEGFSQALAREIEIGQKMASGEQIASAIKEADKMGLKGEKVVPVGSVAMHELMGQLNGPTGVSVGVGRATNFATRAILNSPAFELAQFAQEGLPMAAALARDVVNVPKAIAAVKDIQGFPPELQAEIMATVGSSAGLMGAPSLKALRADGFMDPARVAAHPKAWQVFWRLANGTYLGRFDKARAGVMREAAAVAKIEGDFKRAQKGFNLWRSHANNLFKDMEDAVEAMKGMTPAERAAYVASHPKLGDRLQKSMNGLAGNWNSFTVFEKNIAPFAIFYSFQRYAVLWTLYHFPMDHPVVATALAMAGEVNAQELKKLAEAHGGTPSVIDYTKPVVNGNVLPAGSRFSPVLSAPLQAGLEGKPSAALGALPPPISIPLEAATGKNFYTGGELGENGWLYMLRQGGNLVPLARFLGLPDLGQEKSAGAKLFEEQNPYRAERSFLNPYIGQSGEQYGKEKGLEKLFDTKYGEGNIPDSLDSPLIQRMIDELGEDPSLLPQLKRELLKKIHTQERASDQIKKRESKFFPGNSGFNKAQSELLKAADEAWRSGPSGKAYERKKEAEKTPLEKAEESLEGSSNPLLKKAEEALEGGKNPALEKAEKALGL